MQSRIKLKVCGMRDPANMLDIASLLPDYMGFIFFSKSPRYVGDDFIPVEIPNPIKKVGVFVNEANEVMLKRMHRLNLDYLQLHGKESVQQCEELKLSGGKIIKVFSVGADFDFNETKPFKEVADFFLFDTQGKFPGGNAQTFDWSILNHYDQEIPFFLSGGINPENAIEVVLLKDMNIHALDINSGVEITPGLKDRDKVKKIINILNSNF